MCHLTQCPPGPPPNHWHLGPLWWTPSTQKGREDICKDTALGRSPSIPDILLPITTPGPPPLLWGDTTFQPGPPTPNVPTTSPLWSTSRRGYCPPPQPLLTNPLYSIGSKDMQQHLPLSPVYCHSSSPCLWAGTHQGDAAHPVHPTSVQLRCTYSEHLPTWVTEQHGNIVS